MDLSRMLDDLLQSAYNNWMKTNLNGTPVGLYHPPWVAIEMSDSNRTWESTDGVEHKTCWQLRNLSMAEIKIWNYSKYIVVHLQIYSW